MGCCRCVSHTWPVTPSKARGQPTPVSFQAQVPRVCNIVPRLRPQPPQRAPAPRATSAGGAFRLEGGAAAVYPRHGQVAARLQASFLNQSTGEADATALRKLLLDANAMYNGVFVASGLGTWYPSIEFVTSSYLVRRQVAARCASRHRGLPVGHTLPPRGTCRPNPRDASFGGRLWPTLSPVLCADADSAGKQCGPRHRCEARGGP